MPSRPGRVTDASSEMAHVFNQTVREVTGRLDDLQKQFRPRPKGTSTLVFGSIPANNCVEATAYVTGAHTGGVAFGSPAQGLDIGSPNLSWSARVVGQNKVAVRVCNSTASPIATNTIPWNVSVLV